MSVYINGDDDDIITPEVLARKLLFDDDISGYSGTLLPFIINDEKTDDNDYNRCAGQFEILITVYMEMVYGLLMINHINEHINEDGVLDDTIDLDATFNPDLTEYDISDLTEIFSEKFSKVKIFLSVTEMNNSIYYNEYYCRILLKETNEGKTYFNENKDRLDPNKHYTFLLRNDINKNQTRLNDFYAICSFNNKKVKISFSVLF